MTELHRQILNRLLAAWVAISLAIGAVVFYLGLAKIDGQLRTHAIEEAHELSEALLALLAPDADRAALEQRAAEAVRGEFIAVDVYGPDRQLLARAMDPRLGVTAEDLRRLEQVEFPTGAEPRYETHRVAGQRVMQVLVPLRDASGHRAGYVEGIFLVDPRTLDRLRREMAVTVAIVLCAVLLTTVAFYPVILSLNRDVMRHSRDLLKGNIELMETLGSAVAQRDSNTSLHNYRVTIYAVRLAEAAGLDAESIRQLIAGAFLHDVGKIGISDSILLKPARLTAEEFAVMKTHVTLGVDLLEKSPWLQRARDVVAFHHERYDGGGYMDGLAGEAIPVRARIFAIVDVFDALTSKRPYKEAFPFEEAMDILHGEAGSHFDPRLVTIFADIVEPLFREIWAAPPGAVEARLRGIIDRYYFANHSRAAGAAT